jgi:spore maturation protein CgeB
MRILVADATGPGLLMGSYARALRELGHDVMGLAIPEAAQLSNSGWLRLRRVPVVNRLGSEQLALEGNRILAAEAIRWQPHLLLTAGEDLLAGTLATIKGTTGCRVAMIYPDPLVNLRVATIQALPLYDMVVYACGRFGLTYFESLGAPRTAFIPFGWDERHHPRLTDADLPEPTLDVTFVGEWRPDREAWLEALDGFKVGVWGSRVWQTKTSKHAVGRRNWRGGSAWGKDYGVASRSARITLNLIDITNGPGLNMRAFEAAGVGCFVLATRTQAQEEFFVEGEHIAYFSSADELRDKVHYYLGHASERQRIARNAAVLAESHTYRARAESLLNLLGESPVAGVELRQSASTNG